MAGKDDPRRKRRGTLDQTGRVVSEIRDAWQLSRRRRLSTIRDLGLAVAPHALGAGRALAGSWLTHYGGTAWFWLHRYCGYTVLVLVAFRLIWGFVGTRYASFVEFSAGPRGSARICVPVGARRPATTRSAAGAFALLALLGVQAGDRTFRERRGRERRALLWLGLHATSNRLTASSPRNADWLLAPSRCTCSRSRFYELALRKSVARAMVTGRKPRGRCRHGGGIAGSHTLRAAALLVLLALAFAGLLRLAPDTVIALF